MLFIEKVIESGEGKGTVKGCKELNGSKVDTTLCEGLLEFLKSKVKGGAACRSETEGGTKDPIETVLAKVDYHLATELSQAKVLQPVLIVVVLGQAGEEKDLILNCGGAKIKVLGAIGCLLLPGLKEVGAEKEEWEILCKTDLTSEVPNGDQLTGTCQQLCEWLTEHPFLATIGSKEEEMAAFLVHATGKFNQAAFIDD